MKTKFFICFTALLLAWTINSTAYTQGPDNLAKLKPQTLFEKHIPASKQLRSLESAIPIFRNNINIRAVRHFIQDYDNVSGVKWYPLDDGYVVHFYMNSIKTAVYYYKNGDYKCRLRYYFEDNLAPDIRKLVKRRFYDFSIYCITEYNTHGQTTYEIKMEDKTSWNIIKVVNGEIESVTEYSKA